MAGTERINVEVGDITTWRVDAIVNAANAYLLPGGGVCGAIHAAGGPAIAEQCAALIDEQYPSGVPVGGAVVTTGGALPAQHVVHAVGPIYGRDPEPAEQLAAAYRNSIRAAAGVGARSIAFPAISTGIYGFPPERAAGIVWRTLAEELATAEAPMDVHLVFFSPRDRDTFLAHRGSE
jgi:O-acetyl-ADP-ribose deacetylase (regulator of RNase III)